MKNKYMAARDKRFEIRNPVGRFRGGKLNPVMAHAVRPSEGGILSQNITMQLDPIMGNLITPVTAEVIAVFVPIQACDAIRDPDADYAGLTEVVREKLLTGNPLFGVEIETEISKRCEVIPRKVAGTKRVSTAVRMAHNAAVNFLRLRKYHRAPKLTVTDTHITNALIGMTVLERLNGVLDPDDRINGAVRFDLPNMLLPVEGIGVNSAATGFQLNESVRETSSDAAEVYARSIRGGAASPSNIAVQVDAQNRPNVFARLAGTTSSQVSLADFYNAENMDRLTREMDAILKEDPEYGNENVIRWAHGLAIDTGNVPFILAERQAFFGRSVVGATDTAGVNDGTVRSDMAVSMSFTVPVPKTELGGIIITFAVVKPDETLGDQPHPFLSAEWVVDNFVADELKIDPVPVTMRELDSDVLTADESTVAFYIGNNGLKKSYVNYGISRGQDLDTVGNKNVLWQHVIPVSVSPTNILYPSDLEHYPFADQQAEVVSYALATKLTLQTPIIFGPTPIETHAVIDSENLFEEQ